MAYKTNADMVVCDAFKNESEYWSCSGWTDDVDETIKHLILGQLWGSLWNRLIKSSICKSKQVHFPTDNRVNWAEDTAFCIDVLLLANIIVRLQKPLYHYNTTNEQSLLHTVAKDGNSDVSCIIAKHISESIERRGVLGRFIYEIRALQLASVRDYMDNINRRDMEKFVSTFPDAINHISDYHNIPIRLKVSVWMIRHNMKCLAPMVWKLLVHI